MSINSSIKSGKAANDSNNRLNEMISSSSRMRRENVIKKKRGQNSFLDTYNKNQQEAVTIEDVEQYKNCILNPNSSQDQAIRSVQFFRKVLSNDHSPPIDLVINTGIIPAICNYLSFDDCPELQYESAWVLTNICSGTKEQTAVVLDAGALGQLIRLIDSPSMPVREQVTWALGNIAGDSVQYRDAIINSGCIESLVTGLNDPSCSLLFTRNTVWLLSNLCRMRDGVPTNFEKIKVCLPAMKEYLTSDQEDIVIDACWCFAFVTDGNRANTKYVLQMGVLPIIIQHLGDKNVKLITPALRTVGNVLAGDDEQTQLCLECNVLFYLEQLVNTSHSSIVKESLWCISNITAGNENQIQMVIDRNMIAYCVERIFADRTELQREACWVICNAICGGSPNQILAVLNTTNSLQAICKLLRNGEDKKLINIIIESLDRCIILGDLLQGQQQSDRNEIKCTLEECGCLDALESLTITDDDLFEHVDNFIAKNFGYDDDEDDYVAHS